MVMKRIKWLEVDEQRIMMDPALRRQLAGLIVLGVIGYVLYCMLCAITG